MTSTNDVWLANNRDEENKVTWKRTLCVHKDIWNHVGGDVKYFYDLRNLWIKAFVNELNKNFNYVVCENDEFSIEKI